MLRVAYDQGLESGLDNESKPLKGVVNIGDYIGEYYRGYSGGY